MIALYRNYMRKEGTFDPEKSFSSSAAPEASAPRSEEASRERTLNELRAHDEVLSAFPQERLRDIWNAYESGANFEVEGPEEAEIYIRLIFQMELVRRFGFESENFKPYHNINHSRMVANKGLEIFDAIAEQAPYELIGVTKDSWEYAHQIAITSVASGEDPLDLKLRAARVYQVALSFGHDLVQEGYLAEEEFKRFRGAAPFVPFARDKEGKYIKNDTGGLQVIYDEKESRETSAVLDRDKIKANEYKSALEIHDLLQRFVGKDGKKLFNGYSEDRIVRDVATTYVDVHPTSIESLVPTTLESFLKPVLDERTVRDVLHTPNSEKITADRFAQARAILVTELTDPRRRPFLLEQSFVDEHTSLSSRILSLCDLRAAATLDFAEAKKWGDRELMEIHRDLLAVVLLKQNYILEHFGSYEAYAEFEKSMDFVLVQYDGYQIASERTGVSAEDKARQRAAAKFSLNVVDGMSYESQEAMYDTLWEWELSQTGYYLAQKNQTLWSISQVRSPVVQQALYHAFKLDAGLDTVFDANARASLKKWIDMRRTFSRYAFGEEMHMDGRPGYTIALRHEWDSLLNSLN